MKILILFLSLALASSVEAQSFTGTNVTTTNLTAGTAVVTGTMNVGGGATVTGSLTGFTNVLPATNLPPFIPGSYSAFATNFLVLGCSWEAGVNGNTGAVQSGLSYVNQAAAMEGWNLNQQGFPGNYVLYNVNSAFTNTIYPHNVTLYDLMINDATEIEWTNGYWPQYELAQLVYQCFATGDPGMFTGAYMKTNGANLGGGLMGGWTKSVNPNVPGYTSTTNGAYVNITNCFGRTIFLCVEGWSNGTAAPFNLWIDGSQYKAQFQPVAYWGDTAFGSQLYGSNSAPIIPFQITGLSESMHSVTITNLGFGAYTNLTIDYIACPDMRSNTPSLIVAKSPNVLCASSGGWNTFYTWATSNVMVLNQAGINNAYLWDMARALPYGPHGTESCSHPTPQEYTNLASAFVSDMGLNIPQFPPQNAYSLSVTGGGNLSFPINFNSMNGYGNMLTWQELTPGLALAINSASDYPVWTITDRGGDYSSLDSVGWYELHFPNGGVGVTGLMTLTNGATNLGSFSAAGGFADNNLLTNASFVTTTGCTNTGTNNLQILGFTGTSVTLTNTVSKYHVSLGTISSPQNITLNPNYGLTGSSCAAATTLY